MILASLEVQVGTAVQSAKPCPSMRARTVPLPAAWGAKHDGDAGQAGTVGLRASITKHILIHIPNSAVAVSLTRCRKYTSNDIGKYSGLCIRSGSAGRVEGFCLHMAFLVPVLSMLSQSLNGKKTLQHAKQL